MNNCLYELFQVLNIMSICPLTCTPLYIDCPQSDINIYDDIFFFELKLNSFVKAVV